MLQPKLANFWLAARLLPRVPAPPGLLVGLRHFSAPAQPPASGSGSGGAAAAARRSPLWSPLALAAITAPSPAQGRLPLASLSAAAAPFAAANSPERRAARLASRAAGGGGGAAGEPGGGGRQGPHGHQQRDQQAAGGAPLGGDAAADAAGCDVGGQLPFSLESWGSAALPPHQAAVAGAGADAAAASGHCSERGSADQQFARGGPASWAAAGALALPALAGVADE